MNKGFTIVVATVVVFAAGLCAGMWIQRSQPVPPPPTTLMGELRDAPVTDPNARAVKSAVNEEPSEALKAQIDRLKVEIDAFKKRLEPIKAEFNDGLMCVLTPEQKELKASNDRKHRTPAEAEAAAKEQDQVRRRVRDPLDHMIPVIIVPTTLEQLTNDLKLTNEQRAKVQELLIQRRDKFLQLVDQTPPPSLKLGKIAPLVVGKPATK